MNNKTPKIILDYSEYKDLINISDDNYMYTKNLELKNKLLEQEKSFKQTIDGLRNQLKFLENERRKRFFIF